MYQELKERNFEGEEGGANMQSNPYLDQMESSQGSNKPFNYEERLKELNNYRSGVQNQKINEDIEDYENDSESSYSEEENLKQ